MTGWESLPREESYSYDLLDRSDRLIGTLDGVEGGVIEQSIYSTIRTGGRLDLTLTEQARSIDWLNVRIRPTIAVTTARGVQSWPLGVFIPAAPTRQHGDTAVAMPVELYDKLLILHEDTYQVSKSVAAGALVESNVSDVITATGEYNVNIESSGVTLRNAMVFGPGTSRLQVCNALLEAAGYGSLWVDGAGQFRAERYVPPMQRGLAHEFASGEASIHTPDFTWDEDYFSVPNRMTLIARTDGDTAALTSTRTLDTLLPGSRFTYAARGRWLSRVETDVEAASQAVLDAMCERKLLAAADVTRTVEISHGMIPLALNARVTFADDSTVPVSLGSATVTQQRITLTPGALAVTTLRGVQE